MKIYKLLSASVLALGIVAAVACGGEQQDEPPERTPVPTPTGTPTPEVIYLVDDFYFEAFIINTGDTDSLAMWWAGGPHETTEWQYRVYRLEWLPPSHIPHEVGGWVTVPVNETFIHTHEITGLEAGKMYDVALRPVVEGGVGETTYLSGYVPGQDEYPPVGEGETAIGDGHTQWRVYPGHRSSSLFLMTIPVGMWVRIHYAHGPPAEVLILTQYDRSQLTLSPEGKELEREVDSDAHNFMDTLFDQIIASVRPLPEDDR